MIKNEKQYKISKKLYEDMTEKIDNAEKNIGEDDGKKQAIIDSLKRFKGQVETEIKDYETLKNGKATKLKEREFSELPNLLIEYKISNNLTHKELSKQLGIKEQQLQRYESQGFKTVSFQNLVKFLDLMKLKLTIKEIPSKRRKTKKSTLQP